MADDIHLDHAETIRVFGDVDTINGLEFIVSGSEARISDQWRKVSHRLGIFM